MNNFVKLDVALELMASEISKTTGLYEQTQKEQYIEQLNLLNDQRDKIYFGDMKTIDKVISFYGKE